jgi:hypothetical protein
MKRHSPDWVAELAEITVAGGRIRKARWNPGGQTLELVLRVPAADGWSEVLLRYRNVERLEPPLPQLARLVEDPAGELVGQALVSAAGCWQHRVELRTGPALTVRFADLFLSHSPVVGPQERVESGHRFEVLSC